MITQEEWDKLRHGIKLFNGKQFWECHEALEDVWYEDQSAYRNVYWAIIQVAAALVHYEKQNLLGAQGMLDKAKEKILKSEAMAQQVEDLTKHLGWDSFKLLVFTVPKHCRLENFAPLHNFRFPDLPENVPIT